MGTLPLASSISCKQDSSVRACAAALRADVELKSAGKAPDLQLPPRKAASAARLAPPCSAAPEATYPEPSSAAHAELEQPGGSCLRTHRLQAAGRQLAGVSSPRPAPVQPPGGPDAEAPPHRPLRRLAPWRQLQWGLDFLLALSPQPPARGRCGDS